MAKKRRRKTSRLKILLLFIATPLVVWLLAFFTWFYWNDIARFARDDRFQSPEAARKSERPPENKPKEKILDEDRNKLEEILKKSR